MGFMNMFKGFGKGLVTGAHEGGKLFGPMKKGGLIGAGIGGGVGYLQYQHAKRGGDEDADMMTSLTSGILAGGVLGLAAGGVGTAFRGGTKAYRGLKGGFSGMKNAKMEANQVLNTKIRGPLGKGGLRNATEKEASIFNEARDARKRARNDPYVRAGRKADAAEAAARAEKEAAFNQSNEAIHNQFAALESTINKPEAYRGSLTGNVLPTEAEKLAGAGTPEEQVGLINKRAAARAEAARQTALEKGSPLQGRRPHVQDDRGGKLIKSGARGSKVTDFNFEDVEHLPPPIPS